MFFGFLPERLSIVRIERISAYSFAARGDRNVIWHDVTDVAVLAVMSTDLVSGSNHRGPHRSCGSLRNGLQLGGCLTLCRELLVHMLDHLSNNARIQVSIQLSLNASWMYSCSTHATVPVPFVEGNCEEDVCRLGPPIRNEGLIGRPLKVGILGVHIGEAVTRGRQADQPPTCPDKRSNPVGQYKVAQVISAELRLEAVSRTTEGGGHHTRVGDNNVERFAPFQEVTTAVSHAFKISQVKLNYFEATAFGRTFPAYRCSRRFGLFQVPGRANNLRTMCCKRARSFNSQSGRNPGDKNPFALQIDPS